jgi:hypothetical protein
LRSAGYSASWAVVSPATELLINYFWLHWIYLGVVRGVIIMAAVSGWLRALGVPSVAFCWMVWAILGQASGAYVGPTCWAVLFLSAAARFCTNGWSPAHDAASLKDRLSMRSWAVRAGTPCSEVARTARCRRRVSHSGDGPADVLWPAKASSISGDARRSAPSRRAPGRASRSRGRSAGRR